MPNAVALNSAERLTLPARPSRLPPLHRAMRALGAQSPMAIDPDPDRAREQMKLPVVDPAIVSRAEGLSNSLFKQWERGLFPAELERLVSMTRQIDPLSTNESLGIALVMMKVALASSERRVALPRGFFDLGTRDGRERSVAAARYLLMNVAGLRSARDAEKFSGSHALLKNNGLLASFPFSSPLALVRLAFGPLTVGADPVIRLWTISSPDKWQNDPHSFRLARRGLRWLFSSQVPGVSRSEAGELEIDRAQIKQQEWSKLFAQHHLRGMVEGHPFFNGNYASAVKLGFSLVTPLPVIGIERHLIPPWWVRTDGHWTKRSPDGGLLIDEVTRAVLRNLREVHPTCFDRSGAPLPTLLDVVTDWAVQYRHESLHGLESSNLRVWEALHRVAPHLFGWGEDRRSRWCISFSGIWAGPEGTARLREHMAHTFHRSGLGHYNVSPEQYYFSLPEVEVWLEKVLASHGSLSKFIAKTKLQGAIKNSEAEGSIFKAMDLLISSDRTGAELEIEASELESKDPCAYFKLLLRRRGPAQQFWMSVGTDRKAPAQESLEDRIQRAYFAHLERSGGFPSMADIVAELKRSNKSMDITVQDIRLCLRNWPKEKGQIWIR